MWQGGVIGYYLWNDFTKVKLESHLTPWVKEVLNNAQKNKINLLRRNNRFKQRLPAIRAEVLNIFKG